MIILIEIVIVFIEQLLIIKLLELFCRPKRYNSKRIFIAAIVLTIISLVLNKEFSKHFIINIMPFIFVGSYAFLFLKGSVTRKIGVTLLVVLNVLIINSFFIMVGSLFNASMYHLIYKDEILLGYTLTFANKMCLFLEYGYLKNYLESKYELTINTWRFIIGILVLSLICIGFTLNEFVNYGVHAYYTGIIVITFILVNVLIFRLCIMVSKHANESANQKLLLESIRYETKLLDILQEKTDELSRVNHDFKHHIATVNQLILDGNQENANQYLSSIEIPENMDYINTPNRVLNYILNEKISLAKRSEIDVRYSVLCSEECDYVDNIDISIILGNLLDNAMEGCQGTEDPTVDIVVTMDVYSCVFEIKNTSKEVKIKNNKTIFTTKTDKRNHGFGMINITRTVEKYHGDDFYGYNDGIFTHICILNNPKVK